MTTFRCYLSCGVVRQSFVAPKSGWQEWTKYTNLHGDPKTNGTNHKTAMNQVTGQLGVRYPLADEWAIKTPYEEAATIEQEVNTRDIEIEENTVEDHEAAQ